MDPWIVASATDKGLVILFLAVVVGPFLGVLLRVVNGNGWDRIGKGPLAMEERRSPELESDPEQVDAEVRELKNLVGSERASRP
ncbi:MAG: hypothetical protein AB7T48_03080 [Solirubrobacterales bacterium]